MCCVAQARKACRERERARRSDEQRERRRWRFRHQHAATTTAARQTAAALASDGRFRSHRPRGLALCCSVKRCGEGHRACAGGASEPRPATTACSAASASDHSATRSTPATTDAQRLAPLQFLPSSPSLPSLSHFYLSGLLSPYPRASGLLHPSTALTSASKELHGAICIHPSRRLRIEDKSHVCERLFYCLGTNGGTRRDAPALSGAVHSSARQRSMLCRFQRSSAGTRGL
jgi:hypothetical protein